jgi:hypothetical protein
MRQTESRVVGLLVLAGLSLLLLNVGRSSGPSQAVVQARFQELEDELKETVTHHIEAEYEKSKNSMPQIRQEMAALRAQGKKMAQQLEALQADANTIKARQLNKTQHDIKLISHSPVSGAPPARYTSPSQMRDLFDGKLPNAVVSGGKPFFAYGQSVEGWEIWEGATATTPLVMPTLVEMPLPNKDTQFVEGLFSKQESLDPLVAVNYQRMPSSADYAVAESKKFVFASAKDPHGAALPNRAQWAEARLCHYIPSKSATDSARIKFKYCIAPEWEIIGAFITGDGFWRDCKQLVGLWETTVERAGGKPHFFLDIGGNIGSCTAYWLSHVAPETVAGVLVFEPHPVNVFRMTATLLTFPMSLRKKVVVYPVGLGDVSRVVGISVGTGNMGDSTIEMGSQGGQRIFVETFTGLFGQVPALSAKLFAKIDVQVTCTVGVLANLHCWCAC